MSSSAAAITSVIVAAAQAVGKVYLIGLIGFIATQFPKEKPLLPIAAVPVVARFSFHCLVLSLVFSTTAKSVNIDTIGNYWSLIVGAFGVISISYGVATILSWVLLRKTSTDVDALRIAATFPNIVALPILIFPTLCEFEVVHQGYATVTTLDADAAALKDQCVDESNTMIFCYFFSWSLAFWTFGYPKLLASAERQLQAAEDPTDEDEDASVVSESQIADEENEPSVSHFIETVHSTLSNGGGMASVWCFGYPHIMAASQSSPSSGTRLKAGHKHHHPEGPTFLTALRTTMQSPGFIALACGMITGCIPRVPSMLFEAGGAFRWLGDALETLGTASSPLATMIVAASLVPKSRVNVTHEMSYRERFQLMFFTKDERDKENHRPVILWFILSRLIAAPALVTIVVDLTKCYVGSYVPALAQLIIIVNSCLPGALIIVVVLKSRPELHATATSVAEIYLPSYLMSIFTIAAWTALGLWVTLPNEDGTCSAW